MLFMKWWRRLFSCTFKKKTTQRDDEEPTVDTFSQSVEESEERLAAGKELTLEEKLKLHDDHVNYIAELRWDTIKVYTDAALDEPKKGVLQKKGIAAFFGSGHDDMNFRRPLTECGRLMNDINFLELIAIEEALKELIENPKGDLCCHPVAVFTDNDTCAKYLTNSMTSDKQEMQEKVRQIQELMKQIPGKVSVDHVKSHIGIYGNEMADANAKAAKDKKQKEYEADKRNVVNLLRSLPKIPEGGKRESIDMWERAFHADRIAKAKWNQIAVYTTYDEHIQKKRYAAWFGMEHPLNFAYTTAYSLQYMDGLQLVYSLQLMAIKAALERLSSWEDYKNQDVCIYIQRGAPRQKKDIYENWSKNWSKTPNEFVTSDVPEDLKKIVEEIKTLVNKLRGRVVCKDLPDKELSVVGKQKANEQLLGDEFGEYNKDEPIEKYVHSRDCKHDKA